MSYPIDHGEILNMVAIEYDREKWEHEKWIIPADYDDLVKRYEDWGEQAHKFLEVCPSLDQVFANRRYQSNIADSY